MFAKKGPKPADLPGAILSDLRVVQDKSAKEKKVATARETLDANFLLLKETTFGLNDKSEESGRVAVKAVLETDWIAQVLASFEEVSFDNRKHYADIVCCVLRKEGGVDYMLAHMDLVSTFLDRILHEQSQTALLFLDMVKGCCQQQPLTRKIVASDNLWSLFKAVELPDFAVSASAFLALKEALVLFPDALIAGVGEGSRLVKFVETVTHFVKVGSVTQKKKSLDLINQVLTATAGLVPAFASSVDFAKSLESLILAKGKVAVAAFPLLALVLSSRAVTDEVKHVFGTPMATKEVLLEVLETEKADASIMELLRQC